MIFEAEGSDPPDVIEAGGDIPGVSVAILNGAKQKAVKGYLGGQKQDYSVIQRVWICPQGLPPSGYLQPGIWSCAERQFCWSGATIVVICADITYTLWRRCCGGGGGGCR